jgi:hypothetical protein
MGLDIYHNHLRQVHKTKLQPLLRKKRSKPNRSIEPDPEDLNFYCTSCATKYANFYLFRKHLRGIHKLVALPLKTKAKSKPNHNIEPDPDYSNFYFKSCSTEHPSLGMLRKHLRDEV